MSNEIDFSDISFKKAYDSIDDYPDNNILITGGAGVGKSLILESMFKRLKKRKENAVVVCPTGVSSAILLEKGIPASTIHSFFCLQASDIFEKKLEMNPNRKKLIKDLKYLIFDEISMVSPSLFDHISWILEQLKFKGKLIFFGDFYQLSPVVQLSDPDVENYYISQKYISSKNDKPQFFDSHYYKNLHMKTFKLEKTYRQKDEDFINALCRIRTSSQTDADLKLINSRVIKPYLFQEEKKNLLYLCSTNRLVNIMNKNYETSFEGRPFMDYEVLGTGTYKDNDKEMVRIYEGQQVMCIHNNKEEGYQNGTLGTVIDLAETSVLIDVNGKEKEVGFNTWTDYKISYDSGTNTIETTERGTLTRIGCKVAYASTIHKAQGLTLDALYLDLSSYYIPSSGIYLALSRARNLDGIGLSREITHRDIYIDKRIIDFYSQIEDDKFGEGLFF